MGLRHLPVVAVLRQRVLLIVNPGSRRGLRKQVQAEAAFARRKVVCDVVRTERPGHASQIAESRGRSYDAVFTLGGDGTVMEVIGTLAHSEVPIGVIPGGTGNLIARVLGIPLRVSKAVDALLDGDDARIDLGSIDGRRFAFAAGVGIDAKMVETTSAALKGRFGVLAYFWTGGKAALRHDRFKVMAVVDGQRHERLATMVMIANFGAVFRDLITLGPGIRQDDGLLDLCVFSPKGFRDSIRVTWRLLRKDFRTDPCMLYTAGRSIRIATDPPRPVQADGDLVGMTPFDVVVEPLAAHVLVPRTQ
jgi:YegS/Rv2252/BmrU family lipid kinase